MADQPISITVEPYTGTEQPFIPSAIPPVSFQLQPIAQPEAPAPTIPELTGYAPAPTTTIPSPAISAVKYPLVLNIETLGVDPLKQRIITISFQNGNNPNDTPTVILEEDELTMLKKFLQEYVSGGYNQLIVFNGCFDFRFIVMKMMYYRLPCKDFFKAELLDLYQISQQGRPGFMFSAQKGPNLSDWADYLLKYPKPFTDVKMMEYYKSGDFDKVREFASSQITRTLLIWMLWKAVSEIDYSGQTFANTPTAVSGAPELSEAGYKKAASAASQIQQGKKIICPYCLAEQTLQPGQTSKICSICGHVISE